MEISTGKEPQLLSDAKLCEAIESLECVCVAIAEECDKSYTDLSAYADYSLLNRKQAEEYDLLYASYRDLLDGNILFQQVLADMYTLLERVMSGEAVSIEELEELKLIYMPFIRPASDNEAKGVSTSKKKSRSLGTEALGFSGLETDPRRIETGRNATRVSWSGGVDTAAAETAFMDATSGTHGGKVRYKGKNGSYYIGVSGRRVRKK